MENLAPLLPGELNPPLNITHVTDRAGIEKLSAFCAVTPELGWDSETNVVPFFFDRRIRTIQLGNREQQFVVDLWELAGRDAQLLIAAQGHYGTRLDMCPNYVLLADALRPVLESNKHLKLGQNLEFDYKVTKWCFGLRAWNFYDTEVSEKVIYAGQVSFLIKGFWALDDIVARYIGKRLDKSLQKSFGLSGELTKDQLDYAALDTRLPFSLRTLQMRAVNAHGLARALQIEHDAIPAFGDMHLNGFKVSREKWMRLVNETKARHKENVAILDTHFLPIVGAKCEPIHDLVALEAAWRDERDKPTRAACKKTFEAARRAVREYAEDVLTYEGEAAINYASGPQILDALRKAGFTEAALRDTNDKTLAKHKDKAIIAALRAYRETAKILSTYGEEFLNENIRSETGRVHSTFRQQGAETGRASSTRPNLFNIPKDAEWRECFVSEEGNSIITIDYNGCELRIIAELSGEKVWLDAFNNGWDVHSVGAEIIFGQLWADATEPVCAYAARHEKCSCKGHKILRGRIKAINFGLAYGMEFAALATTLGIKGSESQALMKTYKGKFVMVTVYLENSGRAALATFEARTMSGRRRLFNKPSWEKAAENAAIRVKKYGAKGQIVCKRDVERAYFAALSGITREGKNTPIQGTNADMAKIAMGCGFDADGKPYAWHLLEPAHNAKIVNFVYDEFVIESPTHSAEACMATMNDCMERAGAEFVKRIPMTAEGHIADHWKKE